MMFEDLKAGLAAPLKGMGTAFSSSLLGLAGSLILGFLELQASHAHNRFYNELEEWLSGITELTPGTNVSADQVNRQLSAPSSTCSARVEDLSTRLADQSMAGAIAAGGGDEQLRELARASTSSSRRCAPSRRSCASGSTSRPRSIRKWRAR